MTDAYVELDHIHRLDPTREHMDGSGDAWPYLTQEKINRFQNRRERKKKNSNIQMNVIVIICH